MNLSEVNLLIGTPTKQEKLSVSYFESIMYLRKHIPNLTINFEKNCSIISVARNRIMSLFLNSKEYTRLLFLDDDVGFDAGEMIDMIGKNVDCIGMPVEIKSNPKDFADKNLAGNFTKNVFGYDHLIVSGNNGSVIEVTHLGAAILLLSRNLVEDLALLERDAGNWYYNNRGKCYRFFEDTINSNHNFIGEDYNFCRKVVALGHQPYLYCTTNTSHQVNIEI